MNGSHPGRPFMFVNSKKNTSGLNFFFRIVQKYPIFLKNVIINMCGLALRGVWVGVKFQDKKRYVTLECPLKALITLDSYATFE